MNNNYEQVGIIGVDAGMCWIGDPCYCVTPDCTEHPAQTWKEFCNLLGDDNTTQFNYKKGHKGLGVAVQTGYGDGTYPVYVKRTKNGSIAEVRVVFIEEE